MKKDNKLDKKREKPVSQIFLEKLQSKGVTVLSDTEILEELAVEVYKQHKRNGIVYGFLMGEYSKDKKNQGIINTLTQIQMEMKNQEEYMKYLLDELAE